MRTTETIQLTNDQGEVVDYARVKDRLLEAHRDGVLEITTSLEMAECKEGKLWASFLAKVVTQKGTFSGSSLCLVSEDNVDQKLFEKHETIAVGRALAFAGYLATGEIASAEEMGQWKPKEPPKQENVTTAQIVELKTKWYAKNKDGLQGKDKPHIKTAFKDWITSIVKEDIQDADDFRQWNSDWLKACMEAL